MTTTVLEATPVAAAAAQTVMPPAAAHIPGTEPLQSAQLPALQATHSAPRPLAPRNGLLPATLDEAYRLAEYLADSTMVPKDYIGKPGNVLVAIQWGMEIGMQPLQAMQNIAIINGRPSLWGDAVLALVIAHPSCVDVVERYEGTGDNKKAVCIAKRKGREDKIGEFSIENAKKAGLLSKSGPWQQYPERMLKMRARAFALRDQFADVLKGLAVVEEQRDIEPGSYFSDTGPDGRLDGGSSRPATTRPAKGSEIAEANRPELTENGAAEIVLLTAAAKEGGYAAFRARWAGLTEELRAEIGIAKRNELSALGAEVDERRKKKADAEDVTPTNETKAAA